MTTPASIAHDEMESMRATICGIRFVYERDKDATLHCYQMAVFNRYAGNYKYQDLGLRWRVLPPSEMRLRQLKNVPRIEYPLNGLVTSQQIQELRHLFTDKQCAAVVAAVLLGALQE